jgi:nitroreductase
MRLHVDLLGWLHAVWGAFGVLTGVSLLVLAAGTREAVGEAARAGDSAQAAAILLAVCGTPLAIGGVLFIVVGRMLRRRRQRGRLAALVLAGPNMVLVPFGTALGIYTFWVLLNDDARREFGRPPRAPLPGPTLEGA